MFVVSYDYLILSFFAGWEMAEVDLTIVIEYSGLAEQEHTQKAWVYLQRVYLESSEEL